MDAADIAILETYADSMSPVEKGLLDEVRRLFDEVERLEPFETRAEELEEELAAAKSDADDLQEEVEGLEKRLETARENELESDRKCTVAECALEDLKASIRGLCA